MSQSSKLFLTIEEVADMLRCTVLTVRRWKADKNHPFSKVKGYKPGIGKNSRQLFSLEEVMEFVKNTEETNG